MSLTSLFWSFVTFWAAPLGALWLCVRAAMSRDPQTLRLLAVAAAFVPVFLPLLVGLWVRWTHAPGGTVGSVFLPVILYAPIVPALYLVFWALRTRDERWMRILSALLGLAGLLLPLFNSWRHAMI